MTATLLLLGLVAGCGDPETIVEERAEQRRLQANEEARTKIVAECETLREYFAADDPDVAFIVDEYQDEFSFGARMTTLSEICRPEFDQIEDILAEDERLHPDPPPAPEDAPTVSDDQGECDALLDYYYDEFDAGRLSQTDLDRLIDELYQPNAVCTTG